MADKKRKVYKVYDGEATFEIPPLDPGKYKIKFTFKESENSDEIYASDEQEITINERTSTLDLNTNDEGICEISTDGTKGINVNIHCENTGLDSNKVNGVLTVSIQDSENNLYPFATLNIDDYPNDSSKDYTIDEEMVRTTWDDIVSKTSRANKYGKYLLTFNFEGDTGFSDVKRTSVPLIHTTKATLKSYKAYYNVQPKYESGYTHTFKSTILDGDGNPIPGVVGKWWIRLFDTGTPWSSFSGQITSNADGEFIYEHDIGQWMIDGKLSEGDKYNLQFRVTNPYLSDDMLSSTPTLQMYYDPNNFKVLYDNEEVNDENSFSIPYGADLGGIIKLRRQNSTNTGLNGNLDLYIMAANETDIEKAYVSKSVTVTEGQIDNINTFLSHDMDGNLLPLGNYTLKMVMDVENSSTVFTKNIPFTIRRRNVKLVPKYATGETEFNLNSSVFNSHITFSLECDESAVSDKLVDGSFTERFSYGDVFGIITEPINITDYSDETKSELKVYDHDIDYNQIFPENTNKYGGFKMNIVFERNKMFNKYEAQFIITRKTRATIHIPTEIRNSSEYNNPIKATIVDPNGEPLRNVSGSFKITDDPTKDISSWSTLSGVLTSDDEGIVLFEDPEFVEMINNQTLFTNVVYSYCFRTIQTRLIELPEYVSNTITFTQPEPKQIHIEYGNVTDDVWYPVESFTVLDSNNQPVKNHDILLTYDDNVEVTLTTDNNGVALYKFKESEPISYHLHCEDTPFYKSYDNEAIFSPKTRTISFNELIDGNDGRVDILFQDTENTDKYVGYYNHSDPAQLINTTTGTCYQGSSSDDMVYNLPYNTKKPMSISYSAKEITFKFYNRNNIEKTVTLDVSNQDMSNYRFQIWSQGNLTISNLAFKYKTAFVEETETYDVYNTDNWVGSVNINTENKTIKNNARSKSYCLLFK